MKTAFFFAALSFSLSVSAAVTNNSAIKGITRRGQGQKKVNLIFKCQCLNVIVLFFRTVAEDLEVEVPNLPPVRFFFRTCFNYLFNLF